MSGRLVCIKARPAALASLDVCACGVDSESGGACDLTYSTPVTHKKDY